MISNRTVAPDPVVTSAVAKEHLQIEGNDHDVVIDGVVAAATEYVEQASGKCLGAQTWEFKCAALSGRSGFVFPKTPLISVTSLTYFDKDNASQSLAVDDFTVYSEEDHAWLVPDIGTNWPTMYARPDALTVVAQFGFSSVPPNLRAAINLMAGHLFENRDAVVIGSSAVSLPMGVEHLIGVSRVGWVG